MPMTDLMELAPEATQKEFSDLFAFAKTQGAVQELNRPHYSLRFASAPYEARREIDSLIAGAKYAEHGTAAAHLVVEDLPGYPKVSPVSGSEYPKSWT